MGLKKVKTPYLRFALPKTATIKCNLHILKIKNFVENILNY